MGKTQQTAGELVKPERPKPPAAGMGRKKGVLNKATIEVKAFCRELLDDPTYQASLKQRLREGVLPPAMETLLWHYSYGKPKEQMELTGKDGGPIQVQPVLASQLSTETLTRVVQELEAPKDEETEE